MTGTNPKTPYVNRLRFHSRVVVHLVGGHVGKTVRDVLGGQEMAFEGRAEERESLAAPGTAAVRCDVAAPAINGANLLRNGPENAAFTWR